MKVKFYYFLIFLGILLLTANLEAQPLPGISIEFDTAETPEEVAVSIQILLLLTVLSIAPSILIMMTSFTRITVILSMLRRAMGTQSAPSNQIVIGLSLFLTFFVMAPVFNQINEESFQPYMRGELSNAEAYQNAVNPLRNFMLRQTRQKDLALMINISNTPRPETVDDLPLQVIVPAFAISELRLAFQMGFLLYLPFLMIDMIIASILMSMGMMMLPPVLISAPFKILLFVLIDGWYLVVESIVQSFN